MGEDVYTELMDELDHIASKFKPQASGIKKPLMMVMGGIIALAAGGLGFGGCDRVPQHEERVEYILENMEQEKVHLLNIKDSGFYNRYGYMKINGSPFTSDLEDDDDETELVTWVSKWDWGDWFYQGVVDGPDPDAEVDYAVLAMTYPQSKKEDRRCFVQRDEFTEEMEEALVNHYEIASDAYYRYLEDGNDTIQIELGYRDFWNMGVFCSENDLWEPWPDTCKDEGNSCDWWQKDPK